jgi:hypothetical protein
MFALVLALGGTGYAATQSAGTVKLDYGAVEGSLAAHANGSWFADCPSGTSPSGGGVSDSSDPSVVVTNSTPFNRTVGRIAGGVAKTANAWVGDFYNTGNKAATVTVVAVCAPD